MKKTCALIPLAVAVFSLYGCGTVSNLTSGEKPAIYGGVKVDVEWMSMARQNPALSPEQANLLGIVDLPFSFLGDTLVLPLTLMLNRN